MINKNNIKTIIVAGLAGAILSLAVLFGYGYATGSFPISAEDVNTQLDNGESVVGKEVTYEVDRIIPAGDYGWNMYSGEDTDLNFVVNNAPDIEPGDRVTVTVTGIEIIFGNRIIYCTLQ